MNEQVRIPGTSVTVTQRAPMAAGGSVTAFVPQTLDEVWRFAEIVTASGFAPPGLKTSQAVMVAIMHGAEVGLSPFASIKNIAVINNRPTLWGDMVSGVVRASGKCEYIKETISGDGDTLVATCEVKRKGEPAETRTFSAADAKRAGVWSKAGPWTQYPKRMLAVRARSFALRDVFPDVLGGLDIREEVEDSADMIDVTPPSPSADAPEEAEPTATITRTRRTKREPSPPPTRAPVEEPAGEVLPPPADPIDEVEVAPPVEDAHFEEAPEHDPEDVLASFTEALAQINDKQGAGEVWDTFDSQIRGLGPTFTARCGEVYKARIEELQGETAEERKARLRPAYDAGIAAFYRGRKKSVGPEKEWKEGDYAKSWVRGWDNAATGSEPNPEQAVSPPASDFPGDSPPPARAPASEADLETAYQAGQAARAKGMSPRALPGEYRSDDRAAEAAAWREGWNDAAPAAD